MVKLKSVGGLFVLLLLVVVLCLPNAVFKVSAATTITRVQGNARGTSTTTSISVTMGATPISGNVLVAVVGIANAAPTVSSISQTGVTWTYQIGAAYGSYCYGAVWLGVVGSSPATGITITLSGSSASGEVADVCEYSGILTTGFLDKTATAGGVSSTPSTGTTPTTTQANELCVGVNVIWTGAGALSSPTNSFTLLDGALYTHCTIAYLEKIVTSTGAYVSGTTDSGGVDDWVGCIATFKADTAAPAATVPSTPYNTTLTGAVCNFSCQWSDGTALSKATLETNNTGAYANQTWITLSGIGPSWANFTITLNSTAGRQVNYKWYCNDSANNVGQTNSSGVYMTLTLTSADFSAPTYSLPATPYNTTSAGYAARFDCLWNDNTNVTASNFCTNNTGAWVNASVTMSWINTTAAWANYTITLNSTVGKVVAYLWNASDTIPNWNTSMPAQYVTTTFYASLTVNNATHAWTINPGDNNITVTGGSISITVTANAVFDVQAKGSGDLAYGANSISLGNLLMHATTLANAINMTSSYQGIPGLTNHASGTSIALTFVLWLSCPLGKPAGTYTYTLAIQVIQH